MVFVHSKVVSLYPENTNLGIWFRSCEMEKQLALKPCKFNGEIAISRIHCNSLTVHAIDHSSIGLNRLTMQQMFNEI